MAITPNIAGFQQALTGVGTWDELFYTGDEYGSKAIYGVYIEATTQDIFVRISGIHEKGDGTFFVGATNATGLRIPAGTGQYFYVARGGVNPKSITKVEAAAAVAGALVTWYPVVY